MSHYRSNLRDLEFNLFEVFNRQELLGTGEYADLDEQTVRGMLAEIDRLSRDRLADSLRHADRNPPVYDPQSRSVTLPEPLREAYRVYREAGWWRLAQPAELGGVPCPPSLRWAASELFLAANPPLQMYATGANFASIAWYLGTEQQRTLARYMVDLDWSATMVLTEPDAGSDVGAGRTRATQQPDGSWHIEGVKRFITSGEHDLCGNIIHFVLARPAGHGPGTKGLSLFLVPKYHFDWATGELGERNGVYATGVESKMGMKGSTTCELTFGQDQPAVGWLLGDEHAGIRQMFTIIQFARMTVGIKAIATLSAGYQHALEFARTRQQGADLTRSADKNAPRVTIINHPDVRRSLLTQKAYAEGMRAMVQYAASVADTAEVAKAAGDPDSLAERLYDLMLPVVKGYGAERSYALLAESLQTLGGSGYLNDYPIEQYVRDAKIDSLYEGTTAIQGLDLFFRKMVRDQGEAVMSLLSGIGEFAAAGDGAKELSAERELLATATEDVQSMVGAMVGYAMASQPAMDGDPQELYKVGQHTTRLLFALGDLVCGWLLLRQAGVALSGLEAGAAGADESFYQGKVAVARFFSREVLPALSVQRALVEAADNMLMEIPEAAF